MQGSRLRGYILITVLVLVVGLVITSVARDMIKPEEPVEVAVPAKSEEKEKTERPAVQQSKKQAEPVIWEGTM